MLKSQLNVKKTKERAVPSKENNNKKNGMHFRSHAGLKQIDIMKIKSKTNIILSMGAKRV